jgi:beta-aspartyl-peptidase (threonine type)
VAAAVVVLEDDPLFNAGRGAVYNAAGRHELDASIM